jgi:hypothetical protein
MMDSARSLTLSDLATRIRAEHQAVGDALKHAITAGELLTEAKVQVPHGDWLPWLEANCEMSLRTAQAYMRIAREIGKLDDGNTQRVAHLSIRDALRQFQRTAKVVKTLPPDQFKEVIAEAETTSNRGIYEAAQQRINLDKYHARHEREKEIAATAASPIVEMFRPVYVSPCIEHQELFDRLLKVVDDYLIERPNCCNATICEVVNELYCALQERDATSGPQPLSISESVAGPDIETMKGGNKVEESKRDAKPAAAHVVDDDDGLGIPDFLQRVPKKEGEPREVV